MSTETPTLLEVIEMALHIDRSMLHVSCPGRVKSYDAAKQTVTVEPMTNRVSRNADDERIVDVLPVLPEVPVAWQRGGGYFVTMPLNAGDGGLIVFTDTDIGAWRESGQVSDPGDERRHSLGGAVFYPGLETVARALVGLPTGHLIIGKEAGPTIHIDGSTVSLGGSGGGHVALAADTDDNFAAIVNAAVTSPNPAAFQAAVAALILPSVAATLVRAT